MGRISTKENKNIYHQAREKIGFSREKASEITNIPDYRIERIENEKMHPSPWDVVDMATGYKDASLCNYFCVHECPIGEKYVPEVKIKELPEIVLNMLASLNAMRQKQEKLIEISADGKIEKNELEDFVYIQKELEKISMSVDALKLWAERMLVSGKIDTQKYEELMSK